MTLKRKMWKYRYTTAFNGKMENNLKLRGVKNVSASKNVEKCSPKKEVLKLFSQDNKPFHDLRLRDVLYMIWIVFICRREDAYWRGRKDKAYFFFK